MAVVQSLGVKKGAWGLLRASAVLLVMNVAPALRADAVAVANVNVNADEWVSPVVLDEVPLRSPDGTSPPLASPVVVPLPTGLEAGAVCLAGMAASRWWKRKRRSRR